jgi:hypothetical protein
MYLAHRIIWKLVTGQEPPTHLDHHDRNKKNDVWGNIRLSTPAKNIINQDTRRQNTGFTGVKLSKTGKCWEARIGYQKRYIHLGTYKTKQEAAQARKLAEKTYYGDHAP